MPLGFTSKSKAAGKAQANVNAALLGIGELQKKLRTCEEELKIKKNELENFQRVPGSVKVLPGGDIHRHPSKEELEQREQEAELARQREERRVAREAELARQREERRVAREAEEAELARQREEQVATVAPVVSTLAEQLSQVRLRKTDWLPQSGGKRRTNKKRSNKKRSNKKRSNKKRSNKKRSNRRR
jgi:hypothetical protein